MKASLTPEDLANALRGGFSWLELNSTLLDRLNVFPVPDGDTGNNMTSTLASGIETLGDEFSGPVESMSALAGPFNTELTRCSRGNSGFILARFFHGFFEIASSRDVIDGKTWAECVSNGSFHVNGALFAPVEGTMISILSAVSHAMVDLKTADFSTALQITVDAGTEALFRTPSQLPILARAGVIDSGALGLLCIFRGMHAAVLGEQARREEEADYRFEPDPNAGDDESDKISYRYCTEAVVQRNDVADEGLSDWLKSIGNSIALVNETEILKVHIHTNEPEAVFQRLSNLGELEHRKVDDMEEQSRLVSAGTGTDENVSVLAFVPGEGFERIYEDFGVSDCYLYRETLPSPEEIAHALEKITGSQVIVMPNNSNILPSVMAARDLVSKQISIIPTKSVIQGITACYGYSGDEDVATNIESMNGFLDEAITLSLYKSVQDTRFGDRNLKEGEWFVTRSDDILGAGTSPVDAVAEAITSLDTKDITDASAYHGSGFDPRDLEAVVAAIRNKLPGANIEHHFGGQNKAALIISLE